MKLDDGIGMEYDGDGAVATFRVGDKCVATKMPFAEAHALYGLMQEEYQRGFRAGAAHIAQAVKNAEAAL